MLFAAYRVVRTPRPTAQHMLIQLSIYLPDWLVVPAGEVAARHTGQGRDICDQVCDAGHTVACVHGEASSRQQAAGCAFSGST